MEVYERIKILRKEVLHMRQEEFAAKLKISRGNISNIEIDRVKVTDRVISDICSEFNVNRNWLLYGEGEIFEELTEQQKIMKYTAMLLKDTDSVIAEAIKNFIVTYEQLDDSSKKVLESVAQKYLDNINKSQSNKPN
ncbi:helix-turn-helix domain-containing protein [Lacrimispora sp. AGF001]|uniref:helix-turn-helix domain-containing protein n=1 Tax=Lacrimispora sp. AGF001 TaxID=3401631 RepID=UPI003B43C8D1